MIGGLLKSTSTLAILAAAGLLVGGVTMAPKVARAADLGGDCCADLEERVAELEATTARKGNRKVSLTISGAVHYNIMWWSENGPGANTNPVPTAAQILTDTDAGNGTFDKTSGVYFGNFAGNESNINFAGEGKISSDLTAGFEMQIRADPDVTGGEDQTTAQGLPGLSVRQEYVYIASKSMGALQLGNNQTAYDDSPYWVYGGGAEGGLSGGHFGGFAKLRDTNGGFTDAAATYGQALGEIYDNNTMMLKYVSPVWSGFQIKADVGGNTSWAAEALYEQKFGSVKFKLGAGINASTGESCGTPALDGVAAVAGSAGNQCTTIAGVLNDPTHSNLKSVAVSGSIWDTNSGLYFSAEAAKAYSDISGHDDGNNYWLQAGWEKNVSGMGDTTIYATYYKSNNMLANDTSAHWINVGIDQAIDSVASNVYLIYQRDTWDTPGAGCKENNTVIPGGETDVCGTPGQSIDTVTGGMIVHF